jgi:hypothetical protein
MGRAGAARGAGVTDDRRCVVTLDGGARCPSPVEPRAPVPLCTEHLLVAYDWVARDAGVVDLAPSACLACGCRVGVHYPSGWICAECEWRLGDVPDVELARPRVEVVYYVRYRDRVKIGTSANPRLRLASIPHDEVLAFERGGRALEQRRHAQFAAHRFPRTEWFALHAELAALVAELGAGIDDPWAEYERWLSRRLGLLG